MSWDAVGAIAELVGAIAVLATLIYLSIQVKQNSKLQDRQNEIAVADLFMQRAATVIDLNLRMSDTNVAKTAIGKVYSDQPIEDSEFLDYSAYMNSVLTLHETHHQLNLLGLLPEEQWQQTQEALKTIVHFPRFAEFWARHKIRYSASFRAVIEENMRIKPDQRFSDNIDETTTEGQQSANDT